MINNLKEIIKNRERHNEQQNVTNGQSAQLLNKMDQDIIQNLKLRIMTYESENNKLSEEINSISRNFEALCLKNKEDNFLIKKLEEEINFLKIKIKSLELNNSSVNINFFEDEKQVIIKNYNEKIEKLNEIIKNLEIKLNNSNNQTKLQEKESFYRGHINKVEEKNKVLSVSNETLLKQNKKMKKEMGSLLQSQEQLEKDIAEMRDKLKNLEIQPKKEDDNLHVINNKILKEKDLIEKLLLDSRDKIKLLESQIKDMKYQITEKENKSIMEIDEMNFKLEQLKDWNKNLKDQILNMENCLNLKDSVIFDLNKELDSFKNLGKQNNDCELSISLARGMEIMIKIVEENLLKIFDRSSSMQIMNINNKLLHVEHKLKNFNDYFIKNFEQICDKNKNLNMYINHLKELNELNELIKKNNSSDINSAQIQLNSQLDKFNSEIELKNLRIKELENLREEINSNIKEKDKIILELENKIKIEKTLNSDKDQKILGLELFNNKLNLEKFETDKQSNKEKESYEKKLDKKRLKIYELIRKIENLNKEIENFKIEIEENKKIIEELSNKISQPVSTASNEYKEELKKFCLQVINLSSKLKLSLDTMSMIISCRICTEDCNKLFILSCGHSICENCIKSNKNCTECKNKNFSGFNNNNYVENINYNNIITRFKFVHQIAHDIDYIVEYIDKISKD